MELERHALVWTPQQWNHPTLGTLNEPTHAKCVCGWQATDTDVFVTGARLQHTQHLRDVGALYEAARTIGIGPLEAETVADHLARHAS